MPGLPDDRLSAGPLGIPEPSPAAAEIIPDIVLVPLAAFDRAGHRIGYGAGHYDRTLAHLRKLKAIAAIGLAFAVQEIELVPALSHDVALDYVLTETTSVRFPEFVICAFFSSATSSAGPAAPPSPNICPA